MAYIGNTDTTQAFTPAINSFSGNGSTTVFTLSRPVASVAQVQVVINNVPQNPTSAYTVSGNTLTFTSAPSAGTNNIYVYYTSPVTEMIAPGQGTVNVSSLNPTFALPVAQGGTGITTVPANGAIPVGNGTGYTSATITAGTGISVTNGAGSISIASTVIGGQLQTQTFFSSSSWTAPAGVTKVRVTVIGGGGGGVTVNDCGNPEVFGGPGGSIYAMVTVTPGTAYTVTVGNGGNGVGNNNISANFTAGSGQTSSFGSLASATGGTGAAFALAGSTQTYGSIGTATTTGTVLKQNQGSVSNMLAYSSLLRSSLYEPVFNANNLLTQTGTLATTSANTPGAPGWVYFSSPLKYGQAGVGGCVVVEWVG